MWTQALIAAGNLDLQPVYMTLGDVLVRDVRGLHRGTPVSADSDAHFFLYATLASGLAISHPQPTYADMCWIRLYDVS